MEPTFGQRLVGAVVDGLVLLPAGLLLFKLGDGVAVTVVGLAIAAAYHVVLTARDGRTIGKRVVGTRAVDLTSGATPSLRQAGLRWLTLSAGTMVTAIVPTLSWVNQGYSLMVLIGILVPPLHRGVHDRIASTVVTAGAPRLT